MIKTRLKYCIFDPDPNGNDRYYVRKPGHRKIRIKETFQDSDGRITPTFMKAYFEALEALDGKRAAPKIPREKTFNWLAGQYYRSPKFKASINSPKRISEVSLIASVRRPGICPMQRSGRKTSRPAKTSAERRLPQPTSW